MNLIPDEPSYIFQEVFQMTNRKQEPTMNPWEAHLKVAQKYLGQVLTVHIFAYPHFLLECLLALLLTMIYVYVNYEVTRLINHTIKIRPVNIKIPGRRKGALTVKERKAKDDMGSYSGASVKTSITHVRHEYCQYVKGRRQNARLTEMSWMTDNLRAAVADPTAANVDDDDVDDDDGEENFIGDCKPRRREIATKRQPIAERLTALTPAQFVRLDKEEQMRSIQTVGCMQSLTTLFTNIINKRYPESQMREQLDQAKEDCECSHVTDQVMKYLDSECVTDSLINILNEIIDETTVDHPLPMNGDLTTLVYDIGNLDSKKSASMRDLLLQSPPSTSSTDAHRHTMPTTATPTTTTTTTNPMQAKNKAHLRKLK